MIGVDTNVLLRVPERNHLQCQTARNILNELRGETIAVFPQNLAEFYVVATRANTGTRPGLGMTPATAVQWINFYRRQFVELRDPPDIIERWLELMQKHLIRGINAYDGRFAAACQAVGITHFITFNVKDFRPYSFLTLIDPDRPR